jgi:predicted metalloprotease with PDZ domain
MIRDPRSETTFLTYYSHALKVQLFSIQNGYGRQRLKAPSMLPTWRVATELSPTSAHMTWT